MYERRCARAFFRCSASRLLRSASIRTSSSIRFTSVKSADSTDSLLTPSTELGVNSAEDGILFSLELKFPDSSSDEGETLSLLLFPVGSTDFSFSTR